MIDFPGGLDESDSRLQWADWVELCLLYSPASTFSRSDFREALEIRVTEEDEREQIVEEAFSEIQARATTLQDSYPLQVGSTRVEVLRQREDCVAFAFLLALSTQQFYTETKSSGSAASEPAKLFEHLVADALQAYVGQAIRIGAPREDPVPTGFADCLRYLADSMDEPARLPMNPKAKDEGVDIVAWNPLPDKRGAQLIVLAQCKTGRDWQSDLSDLPLDVWKEQMGWPVAPVKAFAFPYQHLGDQDNWSYIARKGGIPLDRLRLLTLIRDERIPPPILTRMRAWSDGFAAMLPRD